MSKTSSGCTGIATNSQIGGRFALKRGGRVLIADEMGLGKTLQVALALTLSSFSEIATLSHDFIWCLCTNLSQLFNESIYMNGQDLLSVGKFSIDFFLDGK